MGNFEHATLTHMKYVALLRGINVGGNNMIKMVELKDCFETMGFTNIRTYINSGNVIFESTAASSEKLVEKIERTLSTTFGFPLRIVLRSKTQMEEVAVNVPSSWKHEKDLRCYVSFVREPTTVAQVMSEVEIRENVDDVSVGPGVIYMSTLLSGITKSRFTRLIAKKIYQEVTIRNYNTLQKIIQLME